MELKFLLILASLFVVSVTSHANQSNSPLIKLVTDILKNGENDAESESRHSIPDAESESQKSISDVQSKSQNSIPLAFIYYNKIKSESQNSILDDESEWQNPLLIAYYNKIKSESQNSIPDDESEWQNPLLIAYYNKIKDAESESDDESEWQNPHLIAYYNKIKDAESESQNLIPENNGAKQHKLKEHDALTFFFLHKDLHEGKIISLVSLKTKNPKIILPRKIADSIPFSSKRLSEIFKGLSVKDESKEAEKIKKALYLCEVPGIEGEEKYCATSLESMVDFAVSKLGKNIQAISTDAHEQTPNHMYTIERINKRNKDDEAMVCHLHNYPYAVFQCHNVGNSEAFSVSMVGENGGKIESVVICHMDTSPWNADHAAFKYLNVKPGDGPICHFLAENNIVWIRN